MFRLLATVGWFYFPTCIGPLPVPSAYSLLPWRRVAVSRAFPIVWCRTMMSVDLETRIRDSGSVIHRKAPVPHHCISATRW